MESSNFLQNGLGRRPLPCSLQILVNKLDPWRSTVTLWKSVFKRPLNQGQYFKETVTSILCDKARKITTALIDTYKNTLKKCFSWKFFSLNLRSIFSCKMFFIASKTYKAIICHNSAKLSELRQCIVIVQHDFFLVRVNKNPWLMNGWSLDNTSHL